jgi:putative Mg2+ transporter-C (MgtC) family protein
MIWQYIWDNYINLAPGIGQIALRLACAMLVGMLIGLEREYTHRPAGLRTHILVALGACAVSITGEMLFTHYSALGAMPDPARLSAQVITGVGFLGAGTIMKEGASVKGLTTAAGVWAVACLGVTAGFGNYALALMGAVFMIFTLTIVEALQHRFIHGASTEKNFLLETTDLTATLNRINEATQTNVATLLDMAVKQTDGGHTLTFRIYFNGRRHKKHRQRFFDAIATAEEIKEFRPVDTKSATAV